MFFPYRDDNPRLFPPYVTYIIIGINVAVFLFQSGLNFIAEQEFTLRYGLIPATLTDIPREFIVDSYSRRLTQLFHQPIFLDVYPHTPWLTVFTSMFMHGGFAHILGNMWFLWIFGDNVEAALGHLRYAIFYILCGVGAAVAQISLNISSITPMVGASGAIAGVLAAYMFLYPRARVHVFVFLFMFITTVQIPAFIVIGIWLMEQLTNGLGSLGLDTTGGVAWFAHLGGFGTGIVLQRVFKRIQPPRSFGFGR